MVCPALQALPPLPRPVRDPAEFADVLYVQRMRDLGDRAEVARLYAEQFGRPLAIDARPLLYAWPDGALRLGGFEWSAGALINSPAAEVGTETTANGTPWPVANNQMATEHPP